MPGKGHIPDLTERIVRTLKANTNRSAGGLASNAAPSLNRDRVAASRRGSNVIATERRSKIDQFLIEADADDVFTLTFNPIQQSWNVTCSWDLVDDAADDAVSGDYTITGRTLTILDPATVFIGASGTFPKVLQVQYDYYAGLPAAPADPFEGEYVSARRDGTGGTLTPDWPASIAAGDIVLGLYSSGSGSAAPSMPAGWVGVSGASLPSQGIRLYKYVADGSETGAWGASIALPSGAGFHELHQVVYRAVTVGSGSANGPTSGTDYTVPAAAGSSVRFVIAFTNLSVPVVAGVTPDYNATGTLLNAWPMAYRETDPIARSVSMTPSPGTIDWASLTVGMS